MAAVSVKRSIATAFLLQSATRFITNCDRYYKVRWIYYKLRKVLQSAMIITNCDSTDLLDCRCFPWTPPFWNVHYKHAQWILGRDPFNQISNRSDRPFFRNFPVGPNRSIERWTEISGTFGWMDRALSFQVLGGHYLLSTTKIFQCVECLLWT